MQRTIRVRLKPTPEQAGTLLETLRQHTECFNAVSAYGWQHQERNGVRLHHATYRALRERFPALPSQLVIAARERAREALRSALARATRGKKASQPRSRLCPIRYDARSAPPRAM
jgi:predicted transposase